jgi:hypothetical protein
MKIERIMKINSKMYSKALKFFKDDKVKFVVSYSKSFGDRKWHDENNNPRSFGFFKSDEQLFRAKALVIGKHKFSLLVANF